MFSSFNTVNQLTKKKNVAPIVYTVGSANANILSTTQSGLILQYYFSFDVSGTGNTGTTFNNLATSGSSYPNNVAVNKNSSGVVQTIQTVISNSIKVADSLNGSVQGSFYVNGMYVSIIGDNTSTVLTLPTGSGQGYNISFWFYIYTCSNLQNFFGFNNMTDQGATGGSSLHCNINVSGANYNIGIFDWNFTSVYPGSFNIAQSSVNNGWHHIVYTVDTNLWRATLYFDGSQKTQTTSTRNSGSTTTNVTKIGIGHRSDNGDNWIAGYIDNFRIYTGGVMTSASVTALYNNKA